MSVKGAIGAAIGYFVAGPTGAKWGYAIGSALDQPAGQDYSGPRLSDLQVQSSAYGAAIPIVYGNARLSGNIIWALPLIERKITEESSSKGGGGSSQTTYDYYGTFAVSICDNEIAGIRRIWADSILIYDAGDTASLETIMASNSNATGITVYYGTETQEADSLIQADKGAANTQAYRGTAYLVFDQLALEKYGKRIPNISVEVVGAGSRVMRLIERQEAITATTAAFNVTAPYWDAENGYSYVFAGDWTNSYTSSTVWVYKYFSNGSYVNVTGFTVPKGAYTYYNPAHVYSREGAYWVCGGGNPFLPENFRVYKLDEATGLVTGAQYVMALNTQAVSDNQSSFVVADGYIYCLYFGGASTKTLSRAAIDNGDFFVSSGGAFGPRLTLLNDTTMQLNADPQSFEVYQGRIYVLNTNYTIDIFTITGSFVSTITPAISAGQKTSMSRNGFGTNFIRITGGLIFSISNFYIHSFDLDGTNVKYYGSPNGITGYSPYGYGGVNVSDGVYFQYAPIEGGYEGYRTFALESLTSGDVSLSDIVADIGTRSGLEVADQNVSALTESVSGYIITSPMPARSAIEPLQKAYFFDSAEVSNVLTYIKRGGSVVSSIPEDDLGAGESASSLYTHTRRQDSELPSQVLVDYSDVSRSYEVGTQQAQRINSPVENVNKLSLAIVMSADYAKEIAHVLLYDAHVERDKFTLQVTNQYIDLNPTDIIQFTIGSKTRRARIVGISYGKNIELDCVAEDATIYAATSTAGASEDDTQSVGFKGPTNLFLLDIPLLRNEDNDAGMYLAASGYFSGWTGSSIFKSLDSGATYSPSADVLSASVMGKATTVLATAGCTVFDRANTVTVSISSGSLSSSTESLVIQGANFAVLGSEVIQFVTATDNGNGTYTLSTLLRGRRGTDWAVSSHAVGDKFVLLKSTALDRVGAIVNTARHYKPVTFGTSLDIAIAQSKTNTGINQKPFSPKYIKGSRDGGLNLAITWTRRSRAITSPLWNPALFEDSQSYLIQILSGDGGSVVNSYTSSTQSYSYTAAQQTTDFGSTQSTVYVKIYQVSASVGNGYGTEATL
jgi:hypothetical protein